MAFTTAQKRAYYAAHPELRAAYHRRWQRRHPERPRANMRRWRAQRRRAAEIAAAKQVLLAAHRLRAIGVVPQLGGQVRYSLDSWAAAKKRGAGEGAPGFRATAGS